jgi:molybdenum cofactor biosynthesis protein B
LATAENSPDQHRRSAREQGALRIAIVTVSDTRTPETDKNGIWLQEQIRQQGHQVVAYELVKDDPSAIDGVLERLLATDAQVLLFNGGTGIAPRDNTYDALAGRLQKVMPGFGELFRMLSYQDVGAAAMLSRAIAGVVEGRVLFSMPGSHGAVRLAWEKLISPELHHLAWEVVRR